MNLCICILFVVALGGAMAVPCTGFCPSSIGFAVRRNKNMRVASNFKSYRDSLPSHDWMHNNDEPDLFRDAAPTSTEKADTMTSGDEIDDVGVKRLIITDADSDKNLDREKPDWFGKRKSRLLKDISKTTKKLSKVYAVISSLIVFKSIQTLQVLSTQYSLHQLGMVSDWKSLAVVATTAMCWLANGTSLMAGLHAAFTFALMAVYGRTPGKRGYGQKFFEQSQPSRTRALRSLRIALVSILFPMAFIMTAYVPLLGVGGVMAALTICTMVRDAHAIARCSRKLS